MTKPPPNAALDPVLHQPVRTQIVAYLAAREEATFTELKRVLRVSDGNLESHLKKLIAAEYVSDRKDSSSARQQTSNAACSSPGWRSFGGCWKSSGCRYGHSS